MEANVNLYMTSIRTRQLHQLRRRTWFKKEGYRWE